MSVESEESLRELLDLQALQGLVARYARAVDRRDYALLRTLYHDDAIEDRGEMFAGSVDAFIAWLPQVTAPFELTVHRMFNMLFSVDGDRAEGEIYGEAYHRTYPPDAQEIIAGGRYLDRYEKRGGIWRFSYRSSTIDRCQVRAVDPQAYAQAVAGAPAGVAGARDPSYSVLSMFGRMTVGE